MGTCCSKFKDISVEIVVPNMAFRYCYKQFIRSKENEHVEVSSYEEKIIDDDKTSMEKLDLENAVAALPGGYKNVFMLHDIYGFKHKEISKMLGIKEGTSKSQLSHARAAMEKFLSEKN